MPKDNEVGFRVNTPGRKYRERYQVLLNMGWDRRSCVPEKEWNVFAFAGRATQLSTSPPTSDHKTNERQGEMSFRGRIRMPTSVQELAAAMKVSLGHGDTHKFADPSRIEVQQGLRNINAER